VSRVLWGVGCGVFFAPPPPLQPPERRAVDVGDSRAGNRFDSYAGGFSVLYFSTVLGGCFGETLSRFRPDPGLSFIDEEWEAQHFMRRGHVPRDWRTRRLAVRARVPDGARFLDVYCAETAAWLHSQLGPAIITFGHGELDVALLQGADRRVTRLVSDFVWQQRDDDGAYIFDGIRYTKSSVRTITAN
ncbi:MAG: hypothetical protein ACR2HR_02160, partial [Euzebya sp.]